MVTAQDGERREGTIRKKNLDIKMFCYKATDRESVWTVKLGEEEMKITAREKERREENSVSA